MKQGLSSVVKSAKSLAIVRIIREKTYAVVKTSA